MKKGFFSITVIFGFYCLLGLSPFAVFGQVGIGNTDPKESSLLDVHDGNNDKGILIPRVSIADLTKKAPIATPTIEESLDTNLSSATASSKFTRPDSYFPMSVRVFAEARGGIPVQSLSKHIENLFNDEAPTPVSIQICFRFAPPNSLDLTVTFPCQFECSPRHEGGMPVLSPSKHIENQRGNLTRSRYQFTSPIAPSNPLYPTYRFFS